jgi:CHRD domain
MSARTTRNLIMAAVAALVVLAVAGCGGSSNSSTSASVSLKPVESKSGSMEGMSEAEMEGMSGEQAEGSSPEPTEGPTGMPMAPSEAHGTATLEQKGDKLTGTITVTGLKPNSDHAEHLHGPDGSCEPKKMVSNMAVVLPDLEANSKGEATAKVDFTVHQKVVEPGYFIMVHEEPTPASEKDQIGAAPASPAFMQALSKNPGILCGDVEVKN